MGIGHSAFCQKVPTISGGKGGEYYTSDGPKLDLMCGTSCTGFGYDSNVQQRVLNRAQHVPMNTYDYPSVWRQEAEEALAKLHPNYEFAFFSGGAEAVEAAIKVARNLVGNGRKKVAAFERCFHGKTFLTGLLTDGVESEYTTILPYHTSGSHGVEIPDDVFAVVIEPFQCRNGVLIPSRKFVEELIAETERQNVILIDDEISTSLRSGYPLALRRFVPDYDPPIICLGKNYGQGFPVSLVGVRKDLAPKVTVSLTSGYGGNPLACIAVTEAVNEVVSTGLLDTARSKEKPFLEELQDLLHLPAVKDVRGFGLWFGIEFHDSKVASAVAEELIGYGYVVGSVPPCIRLAPPFDIDIETWRTFVRIVQEVIEEVCEL